MKYNDPDFLANILAEIYDSDPLYFEIRKAWKRVFEAHIQLCSGFALAAAAAETVWSKGCLADVELALGAVAAAWKEKGKR